jgi:hypothetical protein
MKTFETVFPPEIAKNVLLGTFGVGEVTRDMCTQIGD